MAMSSSGRRGVWRHVVDLIAGGLRQVRGAEDARKGNSHKTTTALHYSTAHTPTQQHGGFRSVITDFCILFFKFQKVELSTFSE